MSRKYASALESFRHAAWKFFDGKPKTVYLEGSYERLNKYCSEHAKAYLTIYYSLCTLLDDSLLHVLHLQCVHDSHRTSLLQALLDWIGCVKDLC